jgi:hypothetical protein
MIIDMLIGPIWTRLLITRDPITDGRVGIVDLILRLPAAIGRAARLRSALASSVGCPPRANSDARAHDRRLMAVAAADDGRR